MRQGIFVETKNVGAFRRSIDNLNNRDSNQPGFMVVEGESGRGKSQAAINWHSKNESVFLRAWEGLSQSAFLKSLALAATGDSAHGSYRSKQLVVEYLEIDPKPIIVDEADRLDIRRIEDLRDINEATDVPVILIGEEGFYAKLKSRKRIHSRVAELVYFQPVSSEDVILYGNQAADLKISPEAANALTVETHGSFRLVHNFVSKLESFARANNRKEIDMDALIGAEIIRRGKPRKQ